MQRTIRVALGAAVTLVLTACVLTACGSSGDTDPAPSGSPAAGGELTVYSGRNEELVQPLIDQFAEESGIEVTVRYAGTGELAAQLLEEGERTEADVFLAQDGGALGAVAKADLLAELPSETLDLVDERFRAQDGRWVGVSGRARVIAYNPSAVAEDAVPDSVYELTDPAWSGKVGIAPTNASFEAFVTGMRVLDGDETAQGWLQGMADNDVQKFESNNPVLDAVENGVVSLGLINHYYWYERVAEEGEAGQAARLKFLGDDPGGLVNVAGVGIIAGAAEADAAQQLVDHLLSVEGQTYFAEETKEYPLVEGVEPDAALPSLAELQTPAVDLADLDSLAETQAMIRDAGLA